MLVVLYGKSWDNWMDALAPTSNLWKDLTHVEKVITVEGLGFPLQDIANNYKTTVVIPLKEEHILTHPKGYLSLIPSKDVIDIVSYKTNFYNLLTKNDLGEHFPKQLTSPNFAKPFIIKRLNGAGGEGIFLVWNQDRYEKALQQPSLKGQPYILEEYIEGDNEYVFYCVCKDGELLWSTSLIAQPPTDSRVQKGSFTNAAETQIKPDVYDIFKTIFKLLNYNGPANINYKLKEGKPIIFEINPRFGGTLMDPKFRHLLSEQVKTITLNAYVQEGV